jgi:acetyl-CoA C-acetyltransferase
MDEKPLAKPIHTKSSHPVIVGVGQITHRDRISHDEPSPSELARRAVEACVEDSGCSRVLQEVDSLSVVNMFCEAENPTGSICDLLGIKPAVREYTSIGGNTPQWLVNRAADRIAKGSIKTALLVGAEALYSEDRTFDWVRTYEALEGMSRRNEIVGSSRRGFSSHEYLHNAYGATRAYPLFENALRARRGLSIEEHKDFLSRHCAGFSRIGADNPLAWFKKPRSSRAIGEVTAQNRMISFPYTKFMNPIMAVNQAAAVILTSTSVAKGLSIPSDKWVYPLGGAEVTERWLLSDRVNYWSSPAIREMTRVSLGMAGLGIDQVDFFDLYSCFPSATMIAASEMGLDMDDLPALTLTGGLPYFGGPGNNYTMHAIAHTVERIRDRPEQIGLVTGVGLYLTKHSLGIYGGREPARPWYRGRTESIQTKIDGLESPELCLQPEGPATVETYTVVHSRRNEADYAVIIARLENGQRCFAQTAKDADLFQAMETEEFVGKKGVIRPGDNAPNVMWF